MSSIKKVAVCGAGTMGAGIAQVFAQSGFDVLLFDVNEQQLEKAVSEISENLAKGIEKGKVTEDEKKATLAKIVVTHDVKEVKADLVIEAIVEKLEVKQTLFQQLAENNTSDTILVSNTSSISITAIAKNIPIPERFAGMHFFNPAHLMKLVEIVVGAETSIETTQTLCALSETIGKKPTICKDAPGFIVNRVARHFYVESLKIAEEQVASIENVDALLESAGFKMGPFKLMDTIGNDINFAVTSSLFEAFHQDAKFRPSRIQQQKVDAGHLGKKTGKGFYQH